MRQIPFPIDIVKRLGELAGRAETTSRPLAHTLTEALPMHLIDRFVPPPHRDGSAAASTLTEAEQTRALTYGRTVRYSGSM